jgi:hypothetical protein
MTMDQVEELTNKMVQEIKLIKTNIINLTWHMRGGANINDVFNMSKSELDIIDQMIEEHMETTKKSRLPFF